MNESKESGVYDEEGSEIKGSVLTDCRAAGRKPLNLDDKDFAILAVVILCIVSIWAPENIILNAFAGLFGVAVGRSIR